MGLAKKTKNVPTNKKLYLRVKNMVKRRVRVWPSAYASAQVVKEYRKRGGKYRKVSVKSKRIVKRRRKFKRSSRMGNQGYKPETNNSVSLTPMIKDCLTLIYGDKPLSRFGKKIVRGRNLSRWFKEKWVNVCKKKGKGYAKCGKVGKKYPYCRPTIRVSSKTPKTVRQLGKRKLAKMCKLKKNSKKVRLTLLKRKRKSRFGNSDVKKHIKELINDINTKILTKATISEFSKLIFTKELLLNPSSIKNISTKISKFFVDKFKPVFVLHLSPLKDKIPEVKKELRDKLVPVIKDFVQKPVGYTPFPIRLQAKALMFVLLKVLPITMMVDSILNNMDSVFKNLTNT